MEGTDQQRETFLEKVLYKNLEGIWLDGCAAPTVKNYWVNMPLKPGAKPVAMQPIPLSPYDTLRVRYHIWEATFLGKMRKVDVVTEGATQWASPVFVVEWLTRVGQSMSS